MKVRLVRAVIPTNLRLVLDDFNNTWELTVADTSSLLVLRRGGGEVGGDIHPPPPMRSYSHAEQG